MAENKIQKYIAFKRGQLSLSKKKFKDCVVQTIAELSSHPKENKNQLKFFNEVKAELEK